MPQAQAEKNYFMVPNEIFSIGLDYREISLYAYLLRCENRKTYQCYPSYKTIGKAIGMSENTVAKYVRRSSSKSPTPRAARTPCVRLSGRKRVPVPARGLKPDVSRFRQTFAGRKKKQDKGTASQAPPQPPLLPAVRAVSGI